MSDGRLIDGSGGVPWIEKGLFGRLARNSLLNLASEIVPLFGALISLPVILDCLGKDGLGVISLAWIVLGFSSRFDLGLGRSTSKFVAEFAARGCEREAAALVFRSLMASLILGGGGGIVLWLVTPTLIGHVFSVPPNLRESTRDALRILSIAVPGALIAATLRGVLAAFQRFDLVNVVKAPTALLNYLLPAIVALSGGGLREIVIALTIVRWSGTLCLAYLANRVLPLKISRASLVHSGFKAFWSYAGWVTVMTVVAPLTMYMDRMVVASMVSVGALAQYAAAYEVAARVWLIPSSLTATLFPAFSTLEGANRRAQLENVFTTSLKYLMILQIPVGITLFVIARDFFTYWVGSDFGGKSAPLLQIMAIGITFNSMGWIPASLLMGMGRADIRAKLMMIQVPIYGILAVLLTGSLKLTGAALAWSIMGACDCILLFFAIRQVLNKSLGDLAIGGVKKSSLFAVASLLLFGVLLVFTEEFVIRAICVLGFNILWALFAWTLVLEERDRAWLTALIQPLLSRVAAKHPTP